MELSKSKNNRKSLNEVFEDFTHPNPNINEEAYLSMARDWPEESRPKLIKNLNDKDLVVRRKSVKALGYFGHAILLPLASLFIETKDRVLRTSCLKVFVKIAANNSEQPFPEEVMRVVQLAIKEENPEVILTGIAILRQLNNQGLPLLIKLSRDENILKATASITALGEIQDPLAESCLRELLEVNTLDKTLVGSIHDALSANSRIQSYK